jgi:hypothetical protein
MEENMSQTIVTCPKCKTAYTEALIEFSKVDEQPAPGGMTILSFECQNTVNGVPCQAGLNAYRLDGRVISQKAGDAVLETLRKIRSNDTQRDYRESVNNQTSSVSHSNAVSHFRAATKKMSEVLAVPVQRTTATQRNQDAHKIIDMTALNATRKSVEDSMSRISKAVGGPQLEAMRARLRETAQATGRSVSLDSEVDLVKEAMHQVADCLMEFSARETFDREDMYVMLSEVESVFTEVRTALPLYDNEDQMR